MVDQLSAPDAGTGQNQDENVSAPIVFIATPMYGGMATAAYTSSLAQTPGVFMRNGLGLSYMYRVNDSVVASARNNLTHQFLESQATHLMWIDADIGFNPMDIVSMLYADKDIVCGIYPKKEIEWRRVAQAVKDGVPPERLSDHVGSFVVNLIGGTAGEDYETADELFEIGGGGTGFMLIKRRVFDALATDVPGYLQEDITIKEFYATSIDPKTGMFMTEDYHFCKLARNKGFKVYAAPWVRLSHTGTYVFDSPIQLDWLKLNVQG
ncbi:MAG: hypothetical protein WB785_22670 [Mycobacterium sp.]|uniref:hypothetical protein n=1 Tax=Mycobacterium sp. TaxID=1785 RepID=UPI003C62C7F2